MVHCEIQLFIELPYLKFIHKYMLEDRDDQGYAKKY